MSHRVCGSCGLRWGCGCGGKGPLDEQMTKLLGSLPVYADPLNPLGPEVLRLRAENARYREALETTGCRMEGRCGGHWGYCHICVALDPSLVSPERSDS